MTVASSFDLISDIHLDFWVRMNNNEVKQRRNIDRLVDSLIPPDHPSSTLVIAGDLGHYNVQNQQLLISFKRFYDKILIVFGNHDLYLVSNGQRRKYSSDSMKRRGEMKQLAEQLEGVVCLDGTTICIDGVTYGGTASWYDCSFGIQTLNMSQSQLYEEWKKSMNDANLIYPRFTQSTLMDFFNHEYEKLEAVIDESQVIISHVSPDWSHVGGKHLIDPVTSFYYFDGSSLLTRAKGKVWCFGHIHTKVDYLHSDGCRLINNALGYPDERTGTKIRTIQL
ncbi:metallophosphoesterase family protein [Paenibacillus piri]|uniref:Calcineurin-like phosphoesterase domain-containing protein n=1 Tax=Paenibacillus piri TaxID=2547395 RepID=A0A4R5KZY4_9BACL|nr:metallophosphoesterase [Paenibacillus piri]TDG00909.1 hypothetical protein E1757_04670 [Paenibacillus piri]